MSLHAFLMLLLALCLARSVFAADEPSGMVMTLSGSTAPPIAAMSEIPAGTPVKLDAGAEVTFLHYSKCKLVTVSGGTLTVTRTEFSTDGKIVDEKDGPCPRIHQLRGKTSGTVSGGLVMRGIGAVPRWPLNRELIFAGAGTDKLNGASIYAEGKLDVPLVRLDVTGHEARFPPTAPPLAANDRYVLQLTMADRTEPVDMTFIGTAPDGPSLLIVLR